MAQDAEWGRRLRAARRRWEERHDRKLTDKELGEMVGRALDREPFQPQTVGAWSRDGQEPESFSIVRAIASVLGATTGELLGDETARRAEQEALVKEHIANPGILAPRPKPYRPDEEEGEEAKPVRKRGGKAG